MQAGSAARAPQAGSPAARAAPAAGLVGILAQSEIRVNLGTSSNQGIRFGLAGFALVFAVFALVFAVFALVFAVFALVFAVFALVFAVFALVFAVVSAGPQAVSRAPRSTGEQLGQPGTSRDNLPRQLAETTCREH